MIGKTLPELIQNYGNHLFITIVKKLKVKFCFGSEKDYKYVKHWDFILEWWGSNLTSIDNSDGFLDSGELVETASRFCPDLEQIAVGFRGANIKKLEENLSKLRMIKDIKMHAHLNIKHNNSSLIKSLQNLTNLRSLHLYFWSLNKNEIEQLNKLIQLEELTISSVEVEYINNISNLLGHLRILQISKINTMALSHMAEYCTKLQKLFILELIPKNYSNLTPFPYFPKLLYLDIQSCCEIQVYNFIGDLDKRYQNQIQTFGMRDLTLYENEMAHISKFRDLKQLFCKKVLSSSFDRLVGMPLEQLWIKTLTQNAILRLVKESSSLKDLACRCYNIDKEFLPILLDTLQAKGIQADQPFKLNITIPIEFRTKFVTQLASKPNSNLLNLKLLDIITLY
ncbi:uncharacterized protein LOC117781730 isoform X2 [Drosophila innubila]|uniref:uncharacterized protein LOC117781730 isoform X2 n=1 Tax=Drosophila innubila TaxID=198719 RepID=UPI00148E617E|nr:uncharacterized protein LOC117781730 isoform X2 [Drosophila innubila]